MKDKQWVTVVYDCGLEHSSSYPIDWPDHKIIEESRETLEIENIDVTGGRVKK